MSITINETGAKRFRVSGLISIIVGALMVIAGIFTWGMVSSQLSAENITIPDDAIAFQGKTVNGPIDAFIQADIINTHALQATDGKTYAELPQDDPVREVVMNGSFLRASLFTSVIAFGVSLFAMGVGVIFIVVGWAMRALVGSAKRDDEVVTATSGAAA